MDAGREISGFETCIPPVRSGIGLPGGSGWKTKDGGRWLWIWGSRMPRYASRRSRSPFRRSATVESSSSESSRPASCCAVRSMDTDTVSASPAQAVSAPGSRVDPSPRPESPATNLRRFQASRSGPGGGTEEEGGSASAMSPLCSLSSLWVKWRERRGWRGARLTRRAREEYRAYFDRSATMSAFERRGSAGMHRKPSPHRENWAAPLCP